MASLHKYILQFCNRYGVPPERIDIDYVPKEKLGNGLYLGMCWYKWTPEIEPCAYIGVHEWFNRHAFVSKSIAWHEFCHTESWILSKRSDDHNSKWVGRVMRKPFLFLAGEFAAAFVYLYEAARHVES